ncbi:hypothetical protein F4780DRAFT_167525 [Xylariomycetidae sp. FL0641]|nr:hypothetical protein F4780DRAFT_167525 [Xylariomycetidae sp. FL0641]
MFARTHWSSLPEQNYSPAFFEEEPPVSPDAAPREGIASEDHTLEEDTDIESAEGYTAMQSEASLYPWPTYTHPNTPRSSPHPIPASMPVSMPVDWSPEDWHPMGPDLQSALAYPGNNEGQYLPNFVIAIEGCPSTGGTLLALVLQRVLRAALYRTTLDKFVFEPIHVSLLHQDSYQLPREGARIRALPKIKMRPVWPEDRYVAGLDREEDSSKEVEVQNFYRTDCYDLDLLERHLDEPDRWRRSWEFPTRTNPISSKASADFTEIDLQQDRACRNKLRAGSFAKAVKRLRETFMDDLPVNEGNKVSVPGVFIDTMDDPVNRIMPRIPRRITIVEGHTLLAKDNGQLHLKHPVWDFDETRSLNVLDRLQKRFHVSLFLPVTEIDAWARRLFQYPYMDPVFGGTRQPGELWKSRAYSDQVIWPSYNLYHKHILDNRERYANGLVSPPPPRLPPATSSAPGPSSARRRREEGEDEDEDEEALYRIYIRPRDAAPLDETLVWAAETIARALAAHVQSTPRTTTMAAAVAPPPPKPPKWTVEDFERSLWGGPKEEGLQWTGDEGGHDRRGGSTPCPRARGEKAWKEDQGGGEEEEEEEEEDDED